METGTQTEHLLTIPLEVLAVSCITYNMIDKIRDVLQQAERDLWTLLFGNSIPDSVLGQPLSCTPNLPSTSPPPISPSAQPAVLREESNPLDPPIYDTLLSYLPSSNSPTASPPGIYELPDVNNTSTESSDPVMSSNLIINEPVDLGISALIGLAESTVGQLSASTTLKRKPGGVTSRSAVKSMSRGVVTSRESGRNGKSGKRVKHQNGKKENFIDLHAVKIKEEPLTTTEVSPSPPNKQFHCEQCRAEFVCQERLSRHVTMIHSSRSIEAVSQLAAPNLHQCVICNQTFSNSTVLREHQLKHHRHSAVLGAGLICNICGKCSTDKISFDEHKKKHTINKNFRCHVCYKGFSQNDNLLQHLRVIHNDKERKCAN